jgi:hypothetical protein
MSLSNARPGQFRARLAEWWAGAWRWVLMAVGACLAAYLLLERGLSQGVATAACVALLVVGAALTPAISMAIPLIMLPALFVVERAGLGGADLSVSDVALAAAFGSAVLLGTRPFSRPLRQLLWLNLVYQFATLFTVIVNPYVANTVEWFHAWLLVSGALVVGWALGRGGYARIALLLMVATACVIAAATIFSGLIQYASGDFGGVYVTYPLPMHKNHAGAVMAFAAVVAYVHPSWMSWSKNWARAALWLLLVAIVMTQSRQALIGLIVAILIVALRSGSGGRSRLVLLMILPGIWLVAVTIIEQIQSQNQHNSAFQRLQWFREVYLLWRESPLFGHGLRYWTNGPVVSFQPPQAELEVLASAGVIGLLGFAVMWIGIVIILGKLDRAYGTLALAVVLSRLVQGQFDLFWVASSVSIPFVIAGVCLGAQALAAPNDLGGAVLRNQVRTPGARPSSRPHRPRASRVGDR